MVMYFAFRSSNPFLPHENYFFEVVLGAAPTTGVFKKLVWLG